MEDLSGGSLSPGRGEGGSYGLHVEAGNTQKCKYDKHAVKYDD